MSTGGAAGWRSRRNRLGPLRSDPRRVDDGELVAADAAVAVAIDGDPIARARLVAVELLRAQDAVLVAIEAVEQRAACVGVARRRRHGGAAAGSVLRIAPLAGIARREQLGGGGGSKSKKRRG